MPKLGKDGVAAVLGVTPFDCGWVLLFWPKEEKIEEVEFWVLPG